MSLRRVRPVLLALAACAAALATIPSAASAEVEQQYTMQLPFPREGTSVVAQYYDARNLVCARLDGGGAGGQALVTAWAYTSSSNSWDYAATAIDGYGGDKTCARVPTKWESHTGWFLITFKGSGGYTYTQDLRGTATWFTF
jgi:hypothetical protein